MLGIGICSAVSILVDRATLARMTIVAAATVTAFWGFSLIGSGFLHEAITPIGPIIWLSVAFKDLIVASMPFSNPIEKVLKEKPELNQELTKRGMKWM